MLHRQSLTEDAFKAYLSSSPYNFFVKYHFPDLNVMSWDEHSRRAPRDILVCHSCFVEDEKQTERFEEFLKKQKPLRAFDPFGGVGAFGLGMEETCPMKVTHAIEISPSTAKTLQ